MPRRVARTVLRGPGRSNASRLPDGRFYKSELAYVLQGINHYLMRWATQKFKRLRRRRHRAWERLGEVARRYHACSSTGSSACGHETG